jgi:hypothetical protein
VEVRVEVKVGEKVALVCRDGWLDGDELGPSRSRKEPCRENVDEPAFRATAGLASARGKTQESRRRRTVIEFKTENKRLTINAKIWGQSHG